MGRCGIICVVLLSIVTFVAELVFSSIAGYHLYTTGHIVICSIIAGFLVFISIVIQLLSWQLQSLRETEKQSRCYQCLIALLHLFQLGLLWRYMRIMTVQRFSLTRKELWETFMLRTLQSLCCSIPILLLLSYLALAPEEDELRASWQLWAALGTGLVSCAWGLATFRKHQDYCCVVGAVFPGLAILFKAVWRLGEVTCRVLTLVMFVQVQGYWVFLVAGGHWITMLVLISVETVLQETGNSNGSSRPSAKQKSTTCKTVSCIGMKSYVYIFCYLNPCGNKSKFYTAVYYVITCLEALALLALWIIYEPRKQLHIPLALMASISGAVGLSFGALYYSCYHRSGACHADTTVDTACLTECIDCHRNSCHIGRTKRPEEPSNYETNWEQYIDQAAAASAANRLVAAPIEACHNDPVENCRAHEQAYHNVHMPRHNGQRSETPLVLMGYEKQSTHQKQMSNHNRANSVDFLWDNYDLQMRDHMHGVESLELDEIGLNDHNKAHTVRERSSLGQNTDQGYYSGISSSSKENSRRAAMAAILERDPVRHLVDLHAAPKLSPHHDKLRCRARDGAGTLSDGNTSSYSTTSSQRAIVNCGKCGNSLAIDNPGFPAPSMNSLASSTSFASSAPSYYHPRRRASIHVMDRGYYSRRRQQQRRRRLMERPMFGAEGPETLEQAMERIHGAGVLPYGRHNALSSDVTSSAWDYTDSEV